MAQIIDQNTVSDRMNELRWNCQKLQGIASRVYGITSVDPDYNQLMRIVQAKSNSKTIEQAEYVLYECAEQRKKRLIIREDDRRDFRRFCSFDHTRWHRTKYAGPDAFIIKAGKVTVDPAIQKTIEKDCTREVNSEEETEIGWLKSLVSLVNICPSPGAKIRLGRFTMMHAKSVTGIRVEAGKNGDLVVIEQ